MILVNKPDKKFQNECRLLQQQVEKQIKECADYKLEQIKAKIRECKALAAEDKLTLDDIILQLLPVLCIVCSRTDPDASTYDTSAKAIFGTIAGCKRVALNLNLSKQEKNLSILASIVFHIVLKNTVHIMCKSDEEAQTLFASLNERLLSLGIKSKVVAQSDDNQYFLDTYTATVLFGSCQVFVHNSVNIENVCTKMLIPRMVAIITDVNLIPGYATNLYKQNTVINESNRLVGMASIVILCQRFEKVLGMGSCNPVEKYLFLSAFPTQKIDLYDYSLTKMQIKYVKGTFHAFKAMTLMEKNYNIDFVRFCENYKNLLNECVLLLKNDTVSAQIDVLKTNVSKFFEKNPNSEMAVVQMKIKDEKIPVNFFPTDCNNDDFLALVIKRVLDFAIILAWDEFSQCAVFMHDYFSTISVGNKYEGQKPNTVRLMMEFGKAESRAKQYTLDSFSHLGAV